MVADKEQKAKGQNEMGYVEVPRDGEEEIPHVDRTVDFFFSEKPLQRILEQARGQSEHACDQGPTPADKPAVKAEGGDPGKGSESLHQTISFLAKIRWQMKEMINANVPQYRKGAKGMSQRKWGPQ